MFGWDNDARSPTEKTRDALTTAKKTKIKNLIGKCEACRKRFDGAHLDLHHISEASKADGSSDKNTPGNLVVLCPNCHRQAHGGDITKTSLKGTVSSRPDRVKKELRAILKDRPIVIDDTGEFPLFVNPPPPPCLAGDLFGEDIPKPKSKTKKGPTKRTKNSSQQDDDIGSLLFGGKSSGFMTDHTPGFVTDSIFGGDSPKTNRKKTKTGTTRKKRK